MLRRQLDLKATVYEDVILLIAVGDSKFIEQENNVTANEYLKNVQGRGGEEKHSQTLPRIEPPDHAVRNPALYLL